MKLYDPPTSRRPALDPAAVLASSGALVSLMLALSRGPATGWRGTEVPWLVGAGLPLALAFVAIEARSPEPLVPLGALRSGLGSTLLLTLLGQALSIGVGFHMPLYLEEVRGLDAGRTGRWMAVLPVTALLLAPLTGRWSDRAGPRSLTTAGMLVVAAELATLAALGLEPGPAHLLAGLLLVGVGLGLFSVANSSALMGIVTPERLGLASGLQAAARNLGLAAGSVPAAPCTARTPSGPRGGERKVCVFLFILKNYRGSAWGCKEISSASGPISGILTADGRLT